MSSQMKNCIDPINRLLNITGDFVTSSLTIFRINLFQPAGQVGERSGRKIIQNPYRVALLEQLFHKVRPNKACTTSH